MFFFVHILHHWNRLWKKNGFSSDVVQPWGHTDSTLKHARVGTTASLDLALRKKINSLKVTIINTFCALSGLTSHLKCCTLIVFLPVWALSVWTCRRAEGTSPDNGTRARFKSIPPISINPNSLLSPCGNEPTKNDGISPSDLSVYQSGSLARPDRRE